MSRSDHPQERHREREEDAETEAPQREASVAAGRVALAKYGRKPQTDRTEKGEQGHEGREPGFAAPPCVVSALARFPIIEKGTVLAGIALGVS